MARSARLTLAEATVDAAQAPLDPGRAGPQVMPSIGRSTVAAPARSGALAVIDLPRALRIPTPGTDADTTRVGHADRGGAVPGYTMQKQQLQTRLRRIEGQVRAWPA